MSAENASWARAHRANRSVAAGRRLFASIVLLLVCIPAAVFVTPAAPAGACAQSGHAWFDYIPYGQGFVNRGGWILLAAAGVRGDVEFTFRGESGPALVEFTDEANGNCVVNQENFYVNFLPGTYTVTATFQDGNTNRLVIDAYAGTLVVQEPATRPPGSASCGQPAHVFFSPGTIRSGDLLTIGAVAFPRTFSQIRFKDSVNKITRAGFYLPPAGSNCVANHRQVRISLAPGEYIVRGDFIDQNNVLHNDRIGTLIVTP